MDSFTNSAEWSTKFKNDLPDSAFLYIEKGGKKDGEGKTSPRSLRHFPYRDTDGKVDRAHILNAIARISQAKFLNQKQKDRLQARARAIYLKYVKYNSKKANSFVKAMNAVAKTDDTINLRKLIAGKVVTAEGAKIIRDFRSINGYGIIVPKDCRQKIENDPAMIAQIERYYAYLKATAMYDEFGVQIRTPEDIYRLLFEYIRRLCGMGVEEWSERIVN